MAHVPAKAICQSVLDRLTAAMLSGDVGLTTQLMCVPFRARSPGGALEYKTAEEVRTGAEMYIGMYQDDGIVSVTRICETARYLAPDQIVGHHMTRGIRADGTEMEAFNSRLHLFLVEGQWKIASMETASVRSGWDDLLGIMHGPDAAANAFRPVSYHEPDLNMFQGLLDKVCTALLSNDIDSWLALVDLPVTLHRGDEVQVLRTRDDVRRDYAIYEQVFAIQGVTDIVRHASSVRRLDEDTMEGDYTTYILRGANPVIPPWHSTTTIVHRDGGWRINSVTNAMSHKMVTAEVGAPRKADADLTARDVSEFLLDVTGRGLMERDFDLFATAFHLPHPITTMDDSFVMNTRDDLRRAFDSMCAHYKDTGVTDIVRYCDAAEFKSPTRVEATHVSQMMRGNEPLQDPYPVFSVLENHDGAWKIMSSDYAMESTTGRGRALRAGAAAGPDG